MTTLATQNTASSGNLRSGLACVKMLNPLEDSSWDRKIAAFPDATCFHTAAWARVLHDTYGYPPGYFATAGPDGFHSVLPVMGVSSLLTGNRGVSLPFTDCCAPLCSPGVNEQPLIEAAIAHAEEKSWHHVEFRGCTGIPSSAAATMQYFVHRLCLKNGEDAVWSGLSGAARSSIRKARAGVLAVTSGRDEHALKEFFRLHCLTRKRLGVPPQSFAFFSNIRRHLADHDLATIFLATCRGKSIAAAVFLHFGTHVMFKFGASDIAFQHLRANNLLMWEGIRRFTAEGRLDLHMGRSDTDNPGLRRYKLAWGTDEEILAYHRYAPAHRGFVSARNPQRAWQKRIFRHLPVQLSTIIGTVVYPHFG